MNKKADFVKTTIIAIIYLLIATGVVWALFSIYRSFA